MWYLGGWGRCFKGRWKNKADGASRMMAERYDNKSEENL